MSEVLGWVPLKAWFARAGGEYKKREAAAKLATKKWEWWTHPGRGIEPLYQQRHGWAVGRRLSKPPKKPTLQNTAYGLDREGRVVCEREYTYKGLGYYRAFYAWSEHEVEWVRYNDSREAQAVHRAKLDAKKRVVLTQSCGASGGSEVSYAYAGERLARITDTYRDEHGRSTVREYAVSWDDDGKLLTITESYDGGEPTLVYEAPRKGASLEQVLERAADELIAEVPKRVAMMKVNEPAYSVVVAFPGKGNDNFPPTVGVGLERERQDLITRGTIDPSALWNAGDYEHYDTELDSEGVAPIYATANRLISQTDGWEKMSKTFSKVAAALRKLDWSKVLPVTKDFVVIAVDYDETELASALRAATSPKTYAAWKKSKWVP